MWKKIKNIACVIGASVLVAGLTIVCFLISGRKADRRRSESADDRDSRIQEGIANSEERAERVEEGIGRAENAIGRCEEHLQRAEDILRRAIERSRQEESES